MRMLLQYLYCARMSEAPDRKNDKGNNMDNHLLLLSRGKQNSR